MGHRYPFRSSLYHFTVLKPVCTVWQYIRQKNLNLKLSVFMIAVLYCGFLLSRPRADTLTRVLLGIALGIAFGMR